MFDGRVVLAKDVVDVRMDGPEVALQLRQQVRDVRFGDGEQAANNAAHPVLVSKAEESCNDTARVRLEFDGQALYMDCHKFSIALEWRLRAGPIVFSSRPNSRMQSLRGECRRCVEVAPVRSSPEARV